MAMRHDERGAYIHALAIQWREGRVAITQANIEAWAVATSVQDGKRIAAVLSPLFPRGRNRRLEREREIQRLYREGQSDAGKRGAKSRWGRHGNPTDSPLAKDGSASASASAERGNPPATPTEIPPDGPTPETVLVLLKAEYNVTGGPWFIDEINAALARAGKKPRDMIRWARSQANGKIVGQDCKTVCELFAPRKSAPFPKREPDARDKPPKVDYDTTTPEGMARWRRDFLREGEGNKSA